MKCNKIITVTLVIAIVFTSVIVPFAAYAVENTSSWEDKIDENILTSQPDENGKKLVAISREKLSDDNIAASVEEKFGYKVEDYEDEKLYNKNVRAILAKKVETEMGTSVANTVSSKMLALGENLTPIDIALNEGYDKYIAAKRKVITEKYTAYNNAFISKSKIQEADILFNSIYTPWIILSATDDEIEKLAKFAEVKGIYLFENLELKSSLNTVHDVLDTDSITGTKSSLYNSGTGYRGTGIKIGIIEQGRYDENSPHLASISDLQLKYVTSYDLYGNEILSEDDEEAHATLTTSLLVGQAVTINGEIYEGIVPNATVYQTSAQTALDVICAFRELANTYNVTIINLSQGIENPEGTYGLFEAIIDDLISSTGVTFVVAAGNEADPYDSTAKATITSPGLAYNAITVGNAQTKEYLSGAVISSPYEIFYQSSYKEASYLSNKPDICAPGCFLATAATENTLVEDWEKIAGTSLAAPMVSGIVAQVQQKLGVKLNPDRIKAHILISAEAMKHTSDDTAVDENNLIYEKSGVGIINAVNAVEGTDMLKMREARFNLAAASQSSKTSRINFTAGQTVKFVMTYEKPDSGLPLLEKELLTDVYENNVDLFLYNDSTNELVASSTNTTNNVEAIEYTIPTSGYYRVEIVLVNYTQTSENQYLDATAAWRIYED